MRAADRLGVFVMRHIEAVPDHRALSTLDADVCALLIVHAELACLPPENERWESLREQRDKVLSRLSDAQIEQLRWVTNSLQGLFAPDEQSQAA
jgi:hypothetical protein